MRKFASVFAAAALIVVISGAFSNALAFRPATGHRAAMMSGTDATYGSTGKCVRGDCSGKLKPKAMAGHRKAFH